MEQSSQEKEQEIWDNIAESWHSFRQKPHADFIPLLKKYADSWPRGKILDIGCGNCRHLIHFSYDEFDCYGIDFSKKMIGYAEQFCRKHSLNVKLKQAFATSLPFQAESFNYVLSIFLLHHLNAEERVKALSEIKRVLKPNGIALIAVWNKLQRRFLFKPRDLLIPWRVKGITYNRYYHLFTAFELKNLFKNAGLKIKSSNIFGRNLIFLVGK